MESDGRSAPEKEPSRKLEDEQCNSSKIRPNGKSSSREKQKVSIGKDSSEFHAMDNVFQSEHGKKSWNGNSESSSAGRRSEVRKLKRKRRSSRTQSRERHHRTYSNQALARVQSEERGFPEGLIKPTKDAEDNVPFGDGYTDDAGGKKELKRISAGEVISLREKLSGEIDKPVKSSECITVEVEKTSEGEVLTSDHVLRRTADASDPIHQNVDAGKEKTSTDTYTDIYFKNQEAKTLSNQKFERDESHKSKVKKSRPILKRKLDVEPIRWRTVPALETGSSQRAEEGAGRSAALAQLNVTAPPVNHPQDLPTMPAEGLPFNTYLEKYLNQNMEFLHPYLRTPSEVIAGTSRQPSGPVTRLIVTPMSPPEIGSPARLRLPDISPASSFHELDVMHRLEATPGIKTDRLRAMSKFASVKESFRKFLLLKRQSLRQIVSSHHNFLQRAYFTEEKRPFWKSSFLEKNRMENKLKSKTYAITFGWELKHRQVRPENRTLISNLLKLRNSKKYKAAMRANPLKRKQKVLVPVNALDEYNNYLLNEYSKTYALDTSPPLFDKNMGPFPGPLLDSLKEPSHSSDFRSSGPYPENPLYPKESIHSYNTSRKYVSKLRKYDQHNPVSSLLEDSSKVSEKTHALLQASGVKHSPLPSQAKPKLPFNQDALLKIYSPKTEFTKQFSDLLPNSRTKSTLQ